MPDSPTIAVDATPRRVLVMCPLNRHYSREVIQGVIEYARQAGRWELLVDESEDYLAAPALARDADASGLLVRTDSRAVHEALAICGIPAVQMFHDADEPRVPVVLDDEQAFARMGFEHLRASAAEHFAFFDHGGISPRFRHFEAMVEAAGHICHRFPPTDRGTLLADRRAAGAALVDWARSLPKPVGIMCFGDRWGRDMAEACRRAGVNVPDEAAILGVGDDEILCELANPPLTSVDPGGDRIGWEAAACLDDLMNGRPPRRWRTVIQPLLVVHRQSTDMLALGHPEVVAAVRYIRDHALDGIEAADVLRRATVSRKTLEVAFQNAIGRSIYQEILRVRLARVEELLVRTRLPLADIAQRCGFEYGSALSTVFKRKRGITPSAFRRRATLSPASGST